MPFTNSSSRSMNEEDQSRRDGANHDPAMWRKMFNLINAEKWDKTRQILKGRNATLASTAADASGLSVLSIAICSYAPEDIVQRLLQLNPSSTTDTDDFGATPLHLACLNGASAEVIKLIIQHDKGASAVKCDDDRRIPLHHAVEFASQITSQGDSASSGQGSLSEGSGTSSTFQEDLEVIESLCEVSPEMVHFANIKNDTPLDIVHMLRSLAETEKQRNRTEAVYHILQDASCNAYRRNRAKWERQGYFTDFSGKSLKDDKTLSSAASSTFTASTRQSSLPTRIDEDEFRIDTQNEDNSTKIAKAGRQNRRDRSLQEKMEMFGFHS